jgi:hypothetical protein
VAIQTCPTCVVAAPAERIWDFLTRAEKLAAWSGTSLVEGPDRPLESGDRVVLGGFGLKIFLDVREIAPLRKLVVDARLPFGVINYEVIVVSPLDGGRCRVAFN